MVTDKGLIERLTIVFWLVAVQGCVSTQYSQVALGEVSLTPLVITTTDSSWNRAPGALTGFLPKGGQMWTRDGLLLDRLIILPGINNGGTLFISNNDSIVYPDYRTGMLPNEIVELTIGSLTVFFGQQALVESSRLRPTRIGQQSAAMFDFRVNSSEGPTLQGRALAFAVKGQLQLMIYMATEIHYYERNWAVAESLFGSVRMEESI